MMKSLGDLKVGVRIALALGLPAIGMLVFSGMIVVQQWQVREQSGAVEALTGFMTDISAVVHELQKERGLSAGYVGSQGASFDAELRAQHGDSDKIKVRYDRGLARIRAKRLDQDFTGELAKAAAGLALLEETRGKVNALAIDGPATARYYTATIGDLLAIVAKAVLLAGDPRIANTALAYLGILEGKERAGQERAVGNGGFAAKAFAPPVYKRFLELGAEQETYFRSFHGFADMTLATVLDEALRAPAMQEIQRLRQIALDSIATGDTGDVAAPHWFAMATERIDLLKGVEDKTSAILLRTAASIKRQATTELTVFASVAVGLLVVAALMAVVIARGITVPIAGLTGAMTELAAGNPRTEVPALDRKDEIGAMAGAVQVFKENIWHTRELEKKAMVAEIRAEIERAENEARIAREAHVNTMTKFLHGIASGANQASGIDDALRMCLAGICAYTGWSVGHVYACDPKNPGLLKSTDIWERKNPERFARFRSASENKNFIASEGLPGRVMASGYPLWIFDVTRDDNFPRAPFARLDGLKAGIGLPIKANGTVVTVLEFFHDEVMIPDQALLEILGNVCVQMSFVYQRDQTIKELAEARSAAESANRAKSEFLSGMSHELRTPLNAIIGFAQLVLMSKADSLNERQRAQIMPILMGGEHLLNLINEILDLAKIESGKLSLVMEPISLRHVLEGCLILVEPIVDKRNVIVENDCGVDLPDVRSDRIRANQVILNLLSNAAKYNREGGSIRISAEVRDGNYLRLIVADTGLGIPVEKQGDLFKPFNRLGAEKGEIEGTGIGLVVTKRLIEAMDGRIGFSSVEGEGSQFWLDFLLARSIRAEADTARSASNTAVAGPNFDRHARVLLYIEDNRSNLHLMENVVDTVPGLSLISADNGESGLELAESRQPDVIILDLHMPGMNGFDVLARLKNGARTRHIPVLILSADASQATREHALASGAFAFLTKPFTMRELFVNISKGAGQSLS